MRFEYVYFLVIAKWIFLCSHPLKMHDLNHLCLTARTRSQNVCTNDSCIVFNNSVCKTMISKIFSPGTNW